MKKLYIYIPTNHTFEALESVRSEFARFTKEIISLSGAEVLIKILKIPISCL